MNIFELFNTNSPENLVIKVFLMVSSILYLIVAVVLYRQTQVMARTITFEQNWIVIAVSFAQVILALILILIAFFIV
ncbi:hypothetical protein A3G67_00870 [Candidatus Roizmanbacteria bacterium RIFCSPLOWO2_12_FULL_40_12]|uniref:DUF5671 domain-containing protein n=1 Tax=Candidatus Roizmanbacteria bacterium RIFCSPLOWO2_01_FULL_40_42 TaxID=1802066 RepID=A0A1F7J6R4_9BACT|nr:MAG: hypothetical protein A2779_02395 [Candidatus Roizmanbacteria bacterium RIFCSPHIGHO2_01_FULL_40_98]OGK27200.1 MAG: hypothetical protein A3C31_03030 [Candidatus Roizmanbacteria bacterium RIFCSPHIGHO2_02_FULL_40_53]OGK30073.1 MAG: hypothetical protein A2W49_04065 [Candidatus Roizmanbacteria bacterium RIFCSPHIGHO2_12_41_18]OGK36073.1 MAG: hypothetical protein A3E69_02975 [Candidatus Roizmanbacteria bacterium RIFCSPHIGHO2_12_FULL_40_130]OGK51312.1 MAG: hypothetical protein A3B50_02610 [Candi